MVGFWLVEEVLKAGHGRTVLVHKMWKWIGPQRKQRRRRWMAFVLVVGYGYGTLDSINARGEPYFDAVLV